MQKRERFFERLSEEIHNDVPVSFRLSEAIPVADAAPSQLAESAYYRAAGFECRAFYKPVTRPLGPEKP